MSLVRPLALSLVLTTGAVAATSAAAVADPPVVSVDATGVEIPAADPGLGNGGTVEVRWILGGSEGTSRLTVTQGTPTGAFGDRHWVGWSQLPQPVPTGACVWYVRVDTATLHDEVLLGGPEVCHGPAVVEVPVDAWNRPELPPGVEPTEVPRTEVPVPTGTVPAEVPVPTGVAVPTELPGPTVLPTPGGTTARATAHDVDPSPTPTAAAPPVARRAGAGQDRTTRPQTEVLASTGVDGRAAVLLAGVLALAGSALLALRGWAARIHRTS
ncbi:hypothetical protein [Cellulomonas sp.]|uniref:hypothetical protein n=1 Tax=Cellulomonas sp. TaxID=40001 RepID=UPI001B2E0736|nr:hypothetical protein [Cellulomonas sp.]MBO9553988.1 hypothetical protein [Cellulomonas sp.]